MDARETSQAIRKHKALAAMGKLYRTKNAPGQGQGSQKRI